MSYRGEKRIRVWGKIDSGGVGLQVEDCADERGVLVGETIMLLTSPGASLKIVDAADIFPPGCFTCLAVSWLMQISEHHFAETYHLIELAILNHHSMNDTQEALVRGKETSPTSKGVTL